MEVAAHKKTNEQTNTHTHTEYFINLRPTVTRPRLQSRRRGGEDGGEQREVETGKERRRALRALKTID